MGFNVVLSIIVLSLEDYYFADEWHDLEKRKILRVVTAFSRDQEHKIYVQERIKEHKVRILVLQRAERFSTRGESLVLCPSNAETLFRNSMLGLIGTPL